MKRLSSWLPAAMCLCVSLLLPSPLPAAELNDGIDRSDPNFVKASLIVISPGSQLFSCAGHSSIRLECPTFKLDYCFSYESESARDRIWTFLSGGLKMGLFVVPTAEFLRAYEDEGRGATQYELDLCPAVKQRLWKLLDEKVQEGACLPYDYVKRGCAYATMRLLFSAIEPFNVQFAPWPEMYAKSRREILARKLEDFPWFGLFLQTIWGAYECDRDVGKLEKVIFSSDLVELLKSSRINGRSVICSEKVLMEPTLRPTRPVVTPCLVAWLFLSVSILNFFFSWRLADWFFLTVLTFVGGLCMACACLLHLPAFGPSYLLVPFNILPVLLWRWRMKWGGWYAMVVAFWCVLMLASPHALVDSAHVVLAFSFVVWGLGFSSVPSRLRSCFERNRP